jgi:hypothetical protein
VHHPLGQPRCAHLVVLACRRDIGMKGYAAHLHCLPAHHPRKSGIKSRQ